MAMNLDALLRIKAQVSGQETVRAFSSSLKGLEGAAKTSTADLGRMNIAINRMARQAGNTTVGIKQHIAALQSLRDRVDIGGKAYNRLGVEIDQLKGKLRGLDDEAKKTGSTLKDQLVSGLAAVGTGQAISGIVQGAAEFDQAVRTAAAIASSGSGNFQGAFDQLKTEIQAVASAAAGTPVEVANLAVALQRAGFSVTETAQSLRGIVAGAEATSISFEEMGSITADTLRQFGLDTTQTMRVVDLLTDAANSANQKVQDVGEAMKYAAPIAKNLGVSVEDTAATIALLAEAGIRGSDAGTALRAGLTRLQIAAGGADSEVADLTRGNKQLTEAMSALGSQILDTEGKLKPLDQVIMGLKAGMDGLSATDQAVLAKALFGMEAGSKFIALINQSSESIQRMFGDMRDSAGEATETQKKMQGFAYSMEVLNGNIQNVSNSIGNQFIAVLNPLANGLNAVISWTQSWPQPLRDVASAAAAAGIATAGFALAVKTITAAGALTGATAAIKGFASSTVVATIATGGLSGAMTVLRGAILAIPGWGWAIAGVTAIAALSNVLYSNNDEFRQWVNNVGSVIASDFGNAINNLVRLGQDGVEGVSNAWQWLVGATANAAKAIGNAFAGPFGFIANAAQSVFGLVQRAIAGLWNALPEPIRKALGQAGKMAINIATSTPIGYVASVAVRAAQMPRQEQSSSQRQGKPVTAAASSSTTTQTESTSENKSGGGSSGDAAAKRAAKDAERAAEAAQRERERVAGVIRNRMAEAEIMKLKSEQQDRIAAAERAGDQMLVARLRGQERELEIQYQYAQELMRENDLEAQKAIIYQGQVALVANQREIERELNRLAFEAQQRLLEGLEIQSEKQREVKTAMERQAETAEGIAKTLGEGLSSAFDGLISGAENWGESLRQIAAGALNDIARQLIRIYVIEQSISAIKNFLSPASSDPLTKAGGNLTGTGALATSIPGLSVGTTQAFAKGGVVNSPTMFRFANGGTMRNGLMGEAGPEAIIPLKRGRDGKLGVAGGGSSTSITVNVDASGSNVQGSDQQASQLGRAIAAAVQQELIKQKRPGGLLTR